MDLGIKGRVALVTGGDSGMGLKTAEFLLKEGVKVALSDQKAGDLDDAVESLAHLGEIAAFPADLTKPSEFDSLAKAVAKKFGEPSILVHAAGITGPTGDFLTITDADWEKALAIDLMAAVRVCRAFIPAMRAAKWGRIVLFSSEDAVQPYPVELAYCACKAAVNVLAKGLSKAYIGDNVLVNVVSPAFVETPMTDAMMEKRSKEKGVSFDEAIKSFLVEERPGMGLKRRGKAEEVAAAVAFLCSEHASFITGANLRVDGGAVMTVSS